MQDIQTTSKKITVIVPTLNRAKYLESFLRSLLQQNLKPEACVVIDQSDDDQTKNLFEKFDLGKIKKIYAHQKVKSLLKARNNGLDHCPGEDFICFFDDDIVLENDYLRKLSEVLNRDQTDRYAGCMGTMENIMPVRSLISRIFMLPHMGNGKFQMNGMPTFPHGSTQALETEFVSGGMTMYRSTVLKKYRYDEKMVGYGYGDDTDLCYRISRHYKFYYDPSAKLNQVEDVPGRDPGIKHRKGQLQNAYYLLEKNIGVNPKSLALLAWFYVGIILEDLTKLKRSAVLGDLIGIWNVICKKIDTVEGYQALKKI